MSPTLHVLSRCIVAIAALFSCNALAQKAAYPYSESANRIIKNATADSALYKRLATMCDTYGNRLSGSESLERAIDWIIAEAKKDGYDARGEKVMVPHWVRGAESCTMTAPRTHTMPILGLGGSVATPPGGIEAEILVVRSFEELKKRAADAKGKIVLYNVPFTKYGETVQYRVNGAVEAARAGAVASLVRSVGPFSIQSPHTGMLRYNDSLPKIPHAAITLEDAEMIARLSGRGTPVRIRLMMSAQTLPDAESRNVVFEIKGTELPNEVVVMGGHIDSWDVGQGAMDDGGGCFAAWYALNAIRASGLKPRRTIRVVMWTNEENGVRGGAAYAEQHKNERHVLAIESDEGTFKPTGFGYEGGTPQMMNLLKDVATLLKPLGADDIHNGFGGADISPLKERFNTPLLGLEVQGDRYFWFHHTHGDTIDKLNPKELNECAAAMAVMAYVIADMKELPATGK
ncbi:MAG: M20/M25/M40 family metallo-hydrolase [Candidatus Kapabacteria bacterium]|nr:M20/M25/M40 family metallo-hydrolase [Candidatus Kapabacteria bacterium]